MGFVAETEGAIDGVSSVLAREGFLDVSPRERLCGGLERGEHAG
jgi:hypothetical protein